MIQELKDIVHAFREARDAGKETALATVVHVEGSSYRKAGARMLIEDDGNITGAISGGCLEGDALRKALLVIAEKKAKLVTYNTDDEDDAKFGLGLGCRGIIHVLIEPIDSGKAHHPLQLLQQCLQLQKALLITLFSLTNQYGEQAGTCLLLDEEGKQYGQIPNEALRAYIEKDAAANITLQKSSAKKYRVDQDETTVFFEYIKPGLSLVIAGAGNDALPLVKMAELLGWNVTIIDGRPDYLTQKRFPGSCSLLLSKPEKALAGMEINERTAFVLLTHNYHYDLAMLRQLLPLNLFYVGVLGPKRKLERMLDELKDEGAIFSPEQLSKIYGPTGLDIGAETPEEIAVSIIAEINAVMCGRAGSFLRDKQETIHSRSAQKIEEVIVAAVQNNGIR